MARRLFLTLALLLGWTAALGAADKKQLVLLGVGPDGHPVTTHEYLPGLRILKKCLEGTPGLDVQVVHAVDPWRDGPELVARADGVVLFLAEGGRWMQEDPARLKALRQLAARKGGITVLHWAMGTKDAKYIDDAVKLFGGCHGGADRKYQVLETRLAVADAKHPATRGIEALKVKEEFYYKLKFARDGKLTPLMKADIDGEAETVAWAWQRPDGGRSFGFSGLHFHENWGREAYRRLVAQGVLWSLDLPVPEKGLKVEISDDDLKLKK